MTACRICGNDRDNVRCTAREMMFGTREEFEYVECASCGCLQIAAIPERMDRYYPGDYYSYKEPVPPRQPNLRRFLRRQRLENILERPNLLGPLYELKAGRPAFYPWLIAARCKPDYAIADVGCGNGALLKELGDEGFGNLVGIEPFNGQDQVRGKWCSIYREFPAATQPASLDLIMLHASFEHMPDPLDELRRLHRLLKPDRFVLIRTPVKGYAWERYRTDWVQLDAPRHLHIHTGRSMSLLAAASGFRIERVEYDSQAFQFWGSEQYRMDIPLTDPRSYARNPTAALFTPARIRDFEGQSAALNREARGDQACFYLYKP